MSFYGNDDNKVQQSTGSVYGSPSEEAREQAATGRSATLDPSVNVDAPSQRMLVASLMNQVRGMPDGPAKTRIEQMLTAADQTLASGGYIDPSLLSSLDSEARHEDAKDLQQGVGQFVAALAGVATLEGGIASGMNNLTKDSDQRFILGTNDKPLEGSIAAKLDVGEIGLGKWMGGYKIYDNEKDNLAEGALFTSSVSHGIGTLTTPEKEQARVSDLAFQISK